MCYSFGSSQRAGLGFKNGAPGPGTYGLPNKSPKKCQPEWKFGTSQRIDLGKKETPGPGSYAHDKSQTKAVNLSYTMRPKTAYQEGDKFNMPGPGSYEPKIINNEPNQPKYSFGLKTQNMSVYSQKGGNNVGPGQYEYKSTVVGIPCMKVGSSKRSDMALNTWTPGPGTYLNNKFKGQGPKYVFGSQSRDGLVNNQSRFVPGPGAYETKSTINMQVGKSLSSRQKDLTLQSYVPGPGAYNWEKPQTKKSIRIGSAKRDPYSSNQAPGPGSYRQHIFYDKPNLPAYRIGSSQRRPLSASDRAVPGPGNYDVKTTTGEGPSYGFRIKHDDLAYKNRFQPGPGAYQPKTDFTEKRLGSPVFGSETRKGMGKSDQNPGPGNYLVKDQIGGPRWGFGSSQRVAMANSQTPGPGQYNIPKKDIFQVPKYLLNTSSNY